MTSHQDCIYHHDIGRFEFSPGTADDAQGILADTPAGLLHRLINDLESEAVLLAAKQVVDAVIAWNPARAAAAALLAPDCDVTNPAALDGYLSDCRDAIRRSLAAALGEPERGRRALLRERAPIALVAGCWLDNISQPATQPAAVVNDLYRHYVAHQGSGVPERSVPQRRRRRLEENGVFLPEITDIIFAPAAASSDLTLLQACFYLALSRYGATYLPEIVGIHYAYHAIGIDAAAFGEDAGPAAAARDAARRYLSEAPAGTAGRRLAARAVAAAVLGAELERQQAELLAAVARTAAERSLDERVVDIVRRHAPMAGRQHGNVRVGGHRLIDLFASDFDARDFVRALKASPYLKRDAAGDCRFLRAIRFGGPMFGLFDDEEARTFRDWAAAAEAAPAGSTAGGTAVAGHGSAMAADLLERIRQTPPQDVRFVTPPALNDREFFYRLVNIENFPNMLPLARERALRELARARHQRFADGSGGRYTDTTFFDYSPAALNRRIREIYWKKLVGPYRPLRKIPTRDEVVFVQKTFALGNLIDGSWLFRIAKTGRYARVSDGMMFAIYADEMGRGEVRKNHIALIYQVLRSMAVDLPHIRDAAFLDEEELIDELYAFAVYQLSLALFPDSFYPEIIGYNLGIEMFGLGELRLHEMQKLRHWGFDPSYEETHLSIDNLSAGHSHLSVSIVLSHLDRVRREAGEAAMHGEWQRIWTGYASFAQYIEQDGRHDAADAVEEVI